MSNMLFDTSKDGNAIFSEDRKYRYVLYRIWDHDKPKIMFIGLNPSTASEQMDDPTIRRVKGFARGWGYGGVYMMNLFAWVTPYPEELKNCADPIGDNDQWLQMISRDCKDVLFAWGNFKEAKARAKEVAAMIATLFPNAVCLGINKDGTPKHPLYIKSKTSQINFQ